MRLTREQLACLKELHQEDQDEARHPPQIEELEVEVEPTEEERNQEIGKKHWQRITKAR